MFLLRRIFPQLLCFTALAACVADPATTPDPTLAPDQPLALEPTPSPAPNPAVDTAPSAALAAFPAPAAAGYRVQLLQSRPFAIDARTWTLHLVRITRPDGGRTYVQWMPSDKPGPRPLVVITNPYDSVDWSGEALDARWRTYQPQPSGQFLDRDGPGFDGTTLISYYRKTPEELGGEAMPHLFNDFGVLFVHGRYYAGGSVRDDIADMAAGMWFAAEQPQVDRARIGIFGGSWGGFEALYAAQQADPRARPRAIAALYPPSDFADIIGHFLSRTGLAATALIPYVRRIYAATGGPPTQAGTNYSGLRKADLCASLPETLIPHDELDNLVPVSQTRALAATCPTVSPLYWPRPTTPDPAATDHGPIAAEAAPQSSGLWSLLFLHLRLMPPEQPYLIEFYSPASLREHLRTIHAAQWAGRDIGYILPRIDELADPRVYLVDLATCAAPTGCTFERGYDVIVRIIDEIWGS